MWQAELGGHGDISLKDVSADVGERTVDLNRDLWGRPVGLWLDAAGGPEAGLLCLALELQAYFLESSHGCEPQSC